MSVDPFIHKGSQGINPYSYVFNNPLSGTDPTGYEPCKTGSHIKSGGDAGNCAATYDDNSAGKAAHHERQSAVIGQIAYNGNIGGSSDSDTMDIEGELEKANKSAQGNVTNWTDQNENPTITPHIFNGTEVASNNTTIETVIEESWERVFENGRSVTKIDKAGPERALSDQGEGFFLNGVGKVLDGLNIIRGPLAKSVAFDVVIQDFGIYEEIELVQTTKLIEVTRLSKYQFQSKVLDISEPRRTGTKDWRFTNHYTRPSWRVIGCLFSCVATSEVLKNANKN